MKPATSASTPGTADSPVATSPFDSTEAKSLPRCSHRTASGRQCRHEARDTHSGLCPLHCARAATRFAHPSIAATLVGQLTEFKSAESVNDFLSRLLLLLAEDRISPRRAAVMAYTCNLILRSLHAINIENKIAADAPEQIVFDLPRPLRQGFQRTPTPVPAEVAQPA